MGFSAVIDSTPFEAIKNRLQPGQHLLAVSKLQSIQKITQLYHLGQEHFGENYIQEALEKIEKLKDLSIQWHLIGPIQKNKIKFLKNHFSYIHSVDSVELAQKISEKSLAIGHCQKVFIQVNISDEDSKSGFSVVDLNAAFPELKKLSGLKIVGLMTIPPLENEAEKNRIYFKKLKELGQKFNLVEFSMGTSHDYQVALEEGATWIRLGTILFGERQLKHSNP